jgi:hypothetical protein
MRALKWDYFGVEELACKLGIVAEVNVKKFIVISENAMELLCEIAHKHFFP